VQTGVLDVASNRFGPPPKIPRGGGPVLMQRSGFPANQCTTSTPSLVHNAGSRSYWLTVGVGKGCRQAGEQEIEEAVEFGGAVVGG
jgi:hypothetical protein